MQEARPALPPEAPWPLVGREGQVRRAADALARRAPAVFLYGASGVGKSRIAHAIGDAMADGGSVILHAAGNIALSAIPFATLAPALARGERGPSAIPADPLALFAYADAAIAELGAGHGIVLIVDDLDAADSVSVGLIAQLAAAGRLQLIATIREGSPVPEAALPLASMPSALRLDVPPLTVDEIETLITAVLGDPLAHRDAIDLFEASHGNPLFLRELVLGAWDAGGIVHDEAHWRFARAPESTLALRDLIRARLHALAPAERDVIERLAVCEPLEIGEFPGDASAALADLETRGMIRVDESRHGVAITLAHPYYSAAVRETMPRIRAIALLNEQADIVEREGMHAADELRVAIWRLDAGGRADPDLLLRAAGLAHRGLDHRTAARLAEAAIAGGIDTAEAHMMHAELMWSLGRGADALHALERAETAARTGAEPARMLSAIAARRAEVYGSDPLGSERGIRLLDEIGAVAPEQLPMLLLSKASLEMHLLRAHDALAHVEQARALLAAHPAGAAIADLAGASPLSYLQRTDDAIAAARRAYAHAEGAQAAFPRRRAAMVLAGILLDNDLIGEARALVVESLHDAIREDDQFTARMDEFTMARIFWSMGRLDAATRWLRDTVSGAEQRGPGSLRSPALGLMSVIACEQGDLDTAKALRRRMDEGYDREDSLTALAEAWIQRTDGDIDGAASVLIERAETVMPRGAFSGAATFLHQLVRLGSPAHTRDAADRLDALAEIAPGARVRRRARHARAAADEDPVALRSVAEDWERCGALLYAAETFAEVARIERTRGRSREAGADARRSAELAAACEGARTPLLQFAETAEPLTPREREVASLAAQGLSSNEIAQRLFLSPRTVNNHLQSTYAKLGIRGRHELNA